MHFHLYLQPNKMGLTKLKLAAHKLIRDAPTQRIELCQDSRELHQPSTSKVVICLPRPKDSPHHTHLSKNHRRRQENKLLSEEENNYFEVLLMLMWKCLSFIAPKLFKSHDDSSANIGLYQSNIDPNYEEAQELLASNGLLAETVPSISKCVTIGQCMSICMGHSGGDR